jgi:hypothetical protein
MRSQPPSKRGQRIEQKVDEQVVIVYEFLSGSESFFFDRERGSLRYYLRGRRLYRCQ